MTGTLIRHIHKNWLKLHPKLQYDLRNLFNHDTRRLLMSKELHDLSNTLRPTEGTVAELMEHPEHKTEYNNYWLELNYDVQPNSIKAYFIEFGPGFFEVSAAGWDEAGHAWFEGSTGEQRLKADAAAASYTFGCIRALNVIPDELIEHKVQRVDRPAGLPKTDESAALPDIVSIYLRRGQREANGDYSATDRKGHRFHFVRGHWFNWHGERRTWRRSHWRGDPSLGATIQIHKA